jgi:hypothetical protein
MGNLLWLDNGKDFLMTRQRLSSFGGYALLMQRPKTQNPFSYQKAFDF